MVEVPGKFEFAKHLDGSTQEAVEMFLQESIDGSCEGLMVKTLKQNATYEPSKRSLNWLKIKKDYIEGLGDSVDLIPIGGYLGRGKRYKGYGTYLLAVLDEDKYVTVCKVGTGFSDESLQRHFEFFENHKLSKKPHYFDVSDSLAPDVWFDPVEVWECKAADLSLSPVHTAAYGVRASDKGIGLRFPRFLRIRDDKKPEQCTNVDQILEMYDSQFNNSGSLTKRKSLSDDD